MGGGPVASLCERRCRCGVLEERKSLAAKRRKRTRRRRDFEFRILDFEWDEAKRGGGENAEEDAEEDVMLEF